MCDCGNERIATGYQITHGDVLSCKECRYKKAGEHIKRHGMCGTKLWSKYYSMKERCTSEKYSLYHRYGGRGIKVCKEWDESFESFVQWAINSGYKDGLTIERIDNDGDYCPENCRWATPTEQANNRSTNRIVTVNGKDDTLANWVRKTNASYCYVRDRLNAGDDPSKLIGYLIESGDTHYHM